MKQRQIPMHVQELYAHFGIPFAEWGEHYRMDTNRNGDLTKSASKTYMMLYKDIKEKK